MRRLLLIPVLLAAALALSGCGTIDRVFGVGDAIETATPAEQPALTVIAATLTVTGAYATVEDKLDEGILTVAEAQFITTKIDKAAAAVEVAADAVEAGGGQGELKLAEEAIRAFLSSELFREISR